MCRIVTWLQVSQRKNSSELRVYYQTNIIKKNNYHILFVRDVLGGEELSHPKTEKKWTFHQLQDKIKLSAIFTGSPFVDDTC